jgi:hypothetical protein
MVSQTAVRCGPAADVLRLAARSAHVENTGDRIHAVRVSLRSLL